MTNMRSSNISDSRNLSKVMTRIRKKTTKNIASLDMSDNLEKEPSASLDNKEKPLSSILEQPFEFNNTALKSYKETQSIHSQSERPMAHLK